MNDLIFKSSIFVDVDRLNLVWGPTPVFSRTEPVMQLTIHYKDGSE